MDGTGRDLLEWALQRHRAGGAPFGALASAVSAHDAARALVRVARAFAATLVARRHYHASLFRAVPRGDAYFLTAVTFEVLARHVLRVDAAGFGSSLALFYRRFLFVAVLDGIVDDAGHGLHVAVAAFREVCEASARSPAREASARTGRPYGAWTEAVDALGREARGTWRGELLGYVAGLARVEKGLPESGSAADLLAGRLRSNHALLLPLVRWPSPELLRACTVFAVIFDDTLDVAEDRRARRWNYLNAEEARRGWRRDAAAFTRAEVRRWAATCRLVALEAGLGALGVWADVALAGLVGLSEAGRECPPPALPAAVGCVAAAALALALLEAHAGGAKKTLRRVQ